MLWHAVYREHPAAYARYHPVDDLKSAAKVLLRGSADAIAAMVAGWVRVGFTQGNFNGDNCLISGRTMDYGPFGWVEEYDPTYAKWTGSGEHFGFINQPTAGFANYVVLVKAVMPVFVQYASQEELQEYYQEIIEHGRDKFSSTVQKTFRAKLGFGEDDVVGSALWQDLEPLLLRSRADWTLFWRELSHLASGPAPAPALLEERGVFYAPLPPADKEAWAAWLKRWHAALPAGDPAAGMLATNPKYVLREWMLVDAYAAASAGDEAPLRALAELIRRPYQEGSEEEENKYYRRATEEALAKGGTAFFS
mmetsp:Transcript_9462/g.20989  ORF Transcript_9462/g.20989 Transcript_9462/m.20989 type:complete len:308 (-) Transcript_9462:403-1326(-)